MEKIFFDSSALIAIFNERDDNHRIAVNFFHQLIENRDYLFTTDYILDETFTMLKLRAGHHVASSVAKDIIENEEFEIIFIDKDTFDDAFKNYFNKVGDQPDLSFTDCVSFAVMKSFRIDKGFSFDKHFRLFKFQRVPIS
jgi:predicted nucleic acid-binding protein